MQLTTTIVLFSLVGVLLGEPLFTLDFENDTVGKFPQDWEARDEENRHVIYSIQGEDGNKFLHADAERQGNQLGYEKEWNLADYPILRWRWRAIMFPVGENLREKSGNDGVLGVYVVFGGWPIPRAIKYVWSDSMAVGTELPSPFTVKTQYIILRNGREEAGQWVEEERNVLDDYRRLFDEPDALPTARGIAILTDSDNTKTRAVGDYDDITVLPETDE